MEFAGGVGVGPGTVVQIDPSSPGPALTGVLPVVGVEVAKDFGPNHAEVEGVVGHHLHHSGGHLRHGHAAFGQAQRCGVVVFARWGAGPNDDVVAQLIGALGLQAEGPKAQGARAPGLHIADDGASLLTAAVELESRQLKAAVDEIESRGQRIDDLNAAGAVDVETLQRLVFDPHFIGHDLANGRTFSTGRLGHHDLFLQRVEGHMIAGQAASIDPNPEARHPRSRRGQIGKR